MKDKILGMVNLWSTIGGLLGVLLVFPYINMKMDEMEDSMILREGQREEKRIEREDEREVERKEERTEEREAHVEAMTVWADEFRKELPAFVDSLAELKIYSRLLVKIPVSHVNLATGYLRDAGFEYYIKINGKLKKIEEY